MTDEELDNIRMSGEGCVNEYTERGLIAVDADEYPEISGAGVPYEAQHHTPQIVLVDGAPETNLMVSEDSRISQVILENSLLRQMQDELTRTQIIVGILVSRLQSEHDGIESYEGEMITMEELANARGNLTIAVDQTRALMVLRVED